MLTRSGAKLLDFGLARLSSKQSGHGASTLSAERDTLTAEGAILGTFRYMAPEQLEGKEADARTDVFALGTVAYEMATGRKAFEGDSQASLIATIMNVDPPPISSMLDVRGLMAATLNHVVERCLAKDPDARWQTARDVKLELDWIAQCASRAGTGGGATDSSATQVVGLGHGGRRQSGCPCACRHAASTRAVGRGAGSTRNFAAQRHGADAA